MTTTGFRRLPVGDARLARGALLAEQYGDRRIAGHTYIRRYNPQPIL
jgi:hypothetical protein